MSWLSQNGGWIALLLIGGIFVLPRLLARAGGGGGGCGMGDCGGGMMGNSAPTDGSAGQGAGTPPAGGPVNAIDPINRRVLPAGAAISAVYRGQAYYFETRENRDLFESDPEKYLAASGPVGQPIARAGAASAATAPRQHGGCC